MKKLIRKLLDFFHLKRLPGNKIENIEELHNSFKALLINGEGNGIASEKPWKNNSDRLIEIGLHRNPQNFLHWDVIKSTMFVGNPGYIDKELKFLKSTPDWGTRWINAIKESSVGSPERFSRFPASSGNLIHHAYHIAKLEEKTNTKINELDFVFEFGGGYGSMSRLFNNLGFKGKYIIFDLPSYSALQKYYLKSIGLSVYSNDTRSIRSGLICLSEYHELNESLRLNDLSNSLFIGTWSISETPLETRNIILPLALSCEYLFLAYQNKFEKIDNQCYFDEWVKKNCDFNWISWPIEHIPGNTYLIGESSIHNTK